MANAIMQRQRTAPWIGIGASGSWTDYREALEAADIDFDVYNDKAHVWLPDIPGDADGPVYAADVPGIMVNIRKDDNRILGVVSEQYRIVQNEEAFSLLEPFTQAGGIITNAGMTEQGLCFMVLRMRNESILGDDYEFDVLCTNSFNARYPLALIMTPLRIICQNMYRQLMGKHDSMLNVRHLSYAQNKLTAAQTVTQNMLAYSSMFGDSLENLYHTDLPARRLEHVVEMLFPYPKPGGKREQTSIARVDMQRREFMDVYYDAQDNQKFHGSALGFVNAYYDYLSHRDPGKNMPGSWADRRFSNLVSGDAVNQKVLKEVANGR